MGDITFANYGIRADYEEDHTLIAGRYAFQRQAEKKILWDLLSKLEIQATDSCLEVGCGTGNQLIPLSFFVDVVWGVDHRRCIERLQKRYSDSTSIHLVAGNFLDVDIERSFDKILVYSVLHCLESEDYVLAVIDKCLSCLAPGGRLLLGDLPNVSLKERFLSSSQGKIVADEFEVNLAKEHAEQKVKSGKRLEKDDKLVAFDDDFILKILSHVRSIGYNGFLLPQSAELPFGCTREDILICRPA